MLPARPTTPYAAFVAVALAVGSTGCLEKMLTDGQIAATRRGAGALDTIADYELARGAAQAGLVQFEGMHKLSPDNEDALWMLTQGWVGYGYGFAEDDMEAAEDAGKEELIFYHKHRARMAYDRAAFYGVELLSHTDPGFGTARKNHETFKAWLTAHFTKRQDAPNLFWTGFAFLARTNLLKEEPDQVAELFLGVDLLERAYALWPDLEHWGALTALGSYHARSAVAEVDQARQMFEDALQKTGKKNLLALVSYAHSYACVKGDKALYERLLREVIALEDPDPTQRLMNAIALRRAKRYLTRQRMMDCGFEVEPAKK
jgi:hypothetical protein